MALEAWHRLLEYMLTLIQLLFARGPNVRRSLRSYNNKEPPHMGRLVLEAGASRTRTDSPTFQFRM